MSTSKKISAWKRGLVAVVGALSLTAVAGAASAYEGPVGPPRPILERPVYERPVVREPLARGWGHERELGRRDERGWDRRDGRAHERMHYGNFKHHDRFGRR